MKRLLKIGLLVGLAMPASVFAQGFGGNAGVPRINAPLGHTYAAGVMRGSVINLDLSAGTLRIQAGKGTVTLQATPGQLAGLNPGDIVEFPYVNYQGSLWLSPAFGGGRSSLSGTYENQGRVTGAVQTMDRGSGEITVRGQAFRIHPAQLAGVLPGMFVNVIYADVGGVNWVAGITPAGGGSQMGGGQQGAGGR